MRDPLTNLKSTMKRTAFKELSFSDERKAAVKETIRQKHAGDQLQFWKESTLIAVMESLQNEPKHGYEISTQLFQKQDFYFQSNEGQLYTLLHLLENKEIVTSHWENDRKYYSLTRKGSKCLVRYKQGSAKQRLSFKHVLEEASL